MQIQLFKLNYATPIGRNIYSTEVAHSIIQNAPNPLVVVREDIENVVDLEDTESSPVVGAATNLRIEDGALVADMDVEQQYADMVADGTLYAGMVGRGRQWTLEERDNDDRRCHVISDYELLQIALRQVK